MRANIAEKLLITDFIRILKVLPHILRWKIYGIFFLMFIVAIFEVLSILSMSFTAMSVAAPQILLDDPYMAAVMDSLPAIKEICADLRYFTLFASIAVVILTLVKNVFTAILALKQSRVSESVSSFAGAEIMSNFLHNPYTWHISSDSNTTVTALESRNSLSQFLMMILNIYTYTLTSIALVFILVSATPIVIIGVLILTGLLSWFIYASMKRALDRSGKAALQASMEENRARTNAMRGIREVLIYRQQPIFLGKFLDACASGVKARTFLGMAPPIPTWVLEVYGFAAIPFTTWVLIRYYNADMALIAGVVTMVMLAAWRILPLFNRSLSSMVILRGCRPMAMTCLNRLEEILKEKPPQLTEPNPDFHFASEVELLNVSFTYPAADLAALQDISCRIKKGSQIGLIGHSGSGKSTLAYILAGLFPPDSGQILLDGKELDSASLLSYRSRIGFVPQAPYLLAGSIAENVAFSQWGKPWNKDKVRLACKMAALDIAESSDRGIEYELGENGAGLSGGQAQRVSIARALYADPEILILDESTSALDQQTESEIMSTINDLKDRLTLIIIAHRLTTVEQCDWIIWLENGKIRKQGSGADILQEYKESMGIQA